MNSMRSHTLLYYQYDRHRTRTEAWWLRAGRMSFGGSLIRPEATGYGLVFFVENMLQAKGDSLKVRHIAVYLLRIRRFCTLRAALHQFRTQSVGGRFKGFFTLPTNGVSALL